MDLRQAAVADLISEASHVANEARTTFGHLTVSQLNWKPSAERWSVAQCFDHLLNTNKGYFPIIENVLAGQKRTFWQSLPAFPGFWGKFVLNAVDPASARKIRAPKKFQPAQSNIGGSVINDFIDQQSKIVEKMKATEHLELERIVISSPVAAPITYTLMDAYRIIVLHEQRHFQQARRVTEESGFPA